MNETQGNACDRPDKVTGWMSTHRGALVEHGKSLLILLLLVNAIILSGKAGLFGEDDVLQSLGRRFHIDTLHETDSGNQEYSAIAQPLVMAVSSETGVRYAAAYSGETAALYERFATYLGEALGSAGTPQLVGREEWETALSGKGVFFDYVYPQSLQCVAAWQGTQISEEVSDHWASRFFLAVRSDDLSLSDHNDVTLYYLSPAGSYYRCTTALAKSNVEAQMAQYESNGAEFAFENGAYDALDRYTMLVPENSEVPSISVSNPGIPQSIEETMLLFGMNYITASNYPENDGGTVYVDGTSTLRLASDGSIAFERSGGQPASVTVWDSTNSLPDMLEGLYQITEKLTGGKGQAEIQLTNLTYEEATNTYFVCFDYYIDGMQVCLSDGCAAEYTVSNGRIIQANVRLREYQLTGETQTTLTFPQAAALVTASGGRTLVRVYQDSGDGVMVSWLIGTRQHA